MKKIALILLSVIFGALSLSACTTVSGAQVTGKYFERAIFGNLSIAGWLYSETAGDLTEAAEAVGKFLDDFDAEVSTKNEASCIYKFNENVNGAETDDKWMRYPIGFHAYTMLLRAHELNNLTKLPELDNPNNPKTNGYFDPTVYPLMKLWGLRTDEWNDPDVHGSLPTPTQVTETLTHCGLDKIRVTAVGNQFYLDKKDSLVMVDLGAQAKGYAADRIKEILYGFPAVTSALYSLSGNVYAFGRYPVTVKRGDQFFLKSTKPFSSGIVDPFFQYATLVGFDVPDADGISVVTSGDYIRRFYWKDGAYVAEDSVQKGGATFFSHIIDPTTGYPCNLNTAYTGGSPNPYRNDTGDKITSATILHASSERADVYATAVTLMGMEKGIAWLKKHRIEGFLIGSDKTYANLLKGKVITSSIKDGREEFAFGAENLTPIEGYGI